MSASTLLAVIKYIALAVSAIAAVWGLAKETTRKDSDGAKRLTRAGQVSIAFILGSAILSVIAYGLETVVKEQQSAREQARIEADKREAQVRDFLREQREVTRAERIKAHASNLAQEQDLRHELRASREALRQVEQAQRVLLASQPLRSLDFSLRFGNVPQRVLERAKLGEEEVEEYLDGDDNLKYLDSAAEADLVGALRRRHILYPVMRELAQVSEDADIVLMIDLDGTGSMLLPIGFVAKGSSRGFIDNGSALKVQLQEFDHPRAAKRLKKVSPLPYECGRPSFAVDPKNRSLFISGSVPSQCLDRVVHRPEGSIPTATFARGGRVVLLAAGKDGLPIKATNASVRHVPVELCWESRAEPNSVSYQLRLTPNGVTEIAKTKNGRLRRAISIEHGGGPESEPRDYGRCAAVAP